MSKAGRRLQVGDEATTDFRGRVTLVRIIERIDGTRSQSGICFRTDPSMDKYDPFVKLDADWFEPLRTPENLL